MKTSMKRVQQRGRWVWQVRHWRAGRYIRKQFATREEAQAHRESVELDLKAVPGDVPAHVMATLLQAHARAQAGGYSLFEACDQYERARKRQASPIGLLEAFREFVGAKEARGRRERTLSNLKARVGRLVQDLGADTPIGVVTAESVEALIRRGWSPQTVASWLSAVGSFFRWSVKRGYLEANPVDRIERPLVEKRAPLILKASDARAMLETTRRVDPRLTPYVAISLFAGLRNQELMRLRWEHVDLEHGHIHVEGVVSKTRTRRLVTIQPNLAAWLRLGGSIPPRGLRRSWERIRPERFEIDCMRRSFCSHHLAAFGSAAKTALEAGHSESVLFAHYRGLVHREEAESYWNVFPS